MITVNVKQLRLGEDYYQIPYSVIKTLGIKEDFPFIVKDFNDDKEIGYFIVREIRDTWSPIIPIDKSKINWWAMLTRNFKNAEAYDPTKNPIDWTKDSLAELCKRKKEKNMNEKKEYSFSLELTYSTIETHLKAWAAITNADKFVVGISGGKDSTVVAALLVSIFGKERVHGVLMPQGTQSDIHDSFDVVKILGISHSIINIGESVDAITKQIWDRRSMDNVYPNKDMEINLPARIRMSTLHAVGQCIGGRVINTSNLSEDMVGYATQFGDNAGSYAPIQGLTVTEVKQLGKYVASLLLDRGKLGDTTVKERIPDLSWQTHPVDGYKRLIELIDKTPADGLQAQTDEERLGITYKQIDDFIRFNRGDDEVKEKIRKKYKQNKFKLKIVQMPQPDFSYLPNFVKDNA